MYTDHKLLRPDTPQDEIFPYRVAKDKLETIRKIDKHVDSKKIHRGMEIVHSVYSSPPRYNTYKTNKLKDIFYYHPQLDDPYDKPIP